MKKLLTAGINEYATNKLRGCVNDSNNMAALYASKGYEVIKLLDADATKNNIMTELNKLAAEAVAGDNVVFHYSGHGSQLPTTNTFAEIDGYDEVICPVDLILPDGRWTNNYILDNELNTVLGKFAKDVNVEVFLDCCHSGTSLDIAYDNNRDISPVSATQNNFTARYIEPPLLTEGRAVSVPRENINPFKIDAEDIICWSGCTDAQTSADAFIGGTYQGAFTYALLQTNGMREDRYKAIIATMKTYGFTQTPLLSCDCSKLTEDLFA